MIQISVKELWEKGGYGKDNPLENSIAIVRKRGEEHGVPGAAIDAIISGVFIGLSKGDTYSTTKCRCGCGIDKSGTDITHYMVWKVLKVGDQIKAGVAKTIESQLNLMIGQHLKSNKMKPIKPFMDWDRSEANRFRKWLFKVK